MASMRRTMVRAMLRSRGYMSIFKDPERKKGRYYMNSVGKIVRRGILSTIQR